MRAVPCTTRYNEREETPIRVWIETGGDTGGAETYYSEPPSAVARIDWDDWNDPAWDDFDELFGWLENFGDVMPQRTRAELLTRLQPDEAMLKADERYDPNEVMQVITSEDLIDIVWAVLEGGEPLALALGIAKERRSGD